MAACHPRKFKDRIALLNQKQMEGQAQFQAVMQEVSEVWKHNSTPGVYKGQGLQIPQSGLGVPNNFQQGIHHPPHYSKYGGSLPNVNQLASTPSPPVREQESTANTLLGPHQFQQGLCQSLPGSAYSNDHNDQRSGQFSPRGRAIRNSSGDKRFDSSPYRAGERHHSRSLSPYMSPTSKAPWRRISSDSALYQSVKSTPQNELNSPCSDEQETNSNQEDPTNSSGLYFVKEEMPCTESMTDAYNYRPPESPTSPNGSLLSPSQCYNTISTYSIPIPSTISLPTQGRLDIQTYQQPLDKTLSSQYQLNIEQDFLKFGIGSQIREPGGLQQKFGYSGGNVVTSPHQHQDSTPSPNTPSGIPEFVITDFSENNKLDTNSISLKQQKNRHVGMFPFFEDTKANQNGLDTDFTVDQLRQDLEPIDDQMMAILTGTALADPDIQVEEHFKIN